MFEQELELEKRNSSIIPLLLIVTLIVAIAGISLYFVLESRKVLTTAEVSPVLLASIEGQTPVTLHFATGALKSEVDQKPQDPHYKLLAKTGVIVTKPKAKGSSSLIVDLTPAGEKLTKRIPQRRIGAESDLDGAILLLASSASRYMTGSVVTVDGGFLLT